MWPLALAGLGLKIGSSLFGAFGQNKAAKANAAAAKADEAFQFNALALRGTQDQQQATDLDQQADRKIAGDQGLTHLAAGENDVTGNSTAALSNELQFQRGMYHDSVAENLHNQLLQIGTERAGVVARTQARINAVQPANPFAVGLQIAGAALGTADQVGGRGPAYGGGVPTANRSPVGAPSLTIKTPAGNGGGGFGISPMPLIPQSAIPNVGM